MIEPLLVVQCIVSPSLFIFFHDLLRGCTYLRMGHSLQIQFNREDDDKAARFGLPGYPATLFSDKPMSPRIGSSELWATVAFICFQSAIFPFSHRPPELSNQRMARALRTAAAPQMSPKYHSFGCIHTSQWKNMFKEKTCYHILSLCLST